MKQTENTLYANLKTMISRISKTLLIFSTCAPQLSGFIKFEPPNARAIVLRNDLLCIDARSVSRGA